MSIKVGFDEPETAIDPRFRALAAFFPGQTPTIPWFATLPCPGGISCWTPTWDFGGMHKCTPSGARWARGSLRLTVLDANGTGCSATPCGLAAPVPDPYSTGSSPSLEGKYGFRMNGGLQA